MPKKKVEPQKPKRIRRRDTGAKPFLFDQNIANEICDLISTTTDSLKVLCNKNKHWPSNETIWKWMGVNRDFSGQYAAAKRRQAEVLVDEMLEVAKSSNSTESAACNRLLIDTTKWIASKMIPKVYGNQMIIDELKGQNDDMMRELKDLRAELAKKNKKEY